MFTAIMNWDSKGRPIKHQTFETQSDADQFVLDKAGIAPGTRSDAFVVPDPQIDGEYIMVDPVTKTIAVDIVARDRDAVNAVWLTQMRATDDIPRNLEDLYDVLTLEQQEAVSPETRDKILNKKAVRAQKPE